MRDAWAAAEWHVWPNTRTPFRNTKASTTSLRMTSSSIFQQIGGRTCQDTHGDSGVAGGVISLLVDHYASNADHAQNYSNAESAKLMHISLTECWIRQRIPGSVPTEPHGRNAAQSKSCLKDCFEILVLMLVQPAVAL